MRGRPGCGFRQSWGWLVGWLVAWTYTGRTVFVVIPGGQ
jgi:hypothetical protein